MRIDAPQTLGKYEIRGTLGRGAMGVVYDGYDPVIARRVAIKTVQLPATGDAETEEEITRFKREAQAAGRLTHPNIVGVYDYGETADLAYIVMEFVDGPSLKTLLDRRERFAVADVRRIMEGLLAGLQYSHARGVVHRDIKPANIMLTAEGEAKIADFGIARIEASSMTQAGAVLGTPAYMSPEQFRGETVDARSDVYSAGVVLYQLLTGERPFEGGVTAIMHKVLTSEPAPPSTIAGTTPAALDRVVLRAIAKRPDDRYPTAAALAEAIRAALRPTAAVAPEEETQVSRAPPRPVELPAAAPATQARRTGVKLWAAAALAGLAVLAGGGFVLLRPVAPAPPPSAPAPLPAHAAAAAILAEQPADLPAPAAAQAPAPPPSPAAVPAAAPPRPPAAVSEKPVLPAAQTPAAPAAVPPPSAAEPPQRIALAGPGPVRDMLARARCAVVDAAAQDSGAITVSGIAGATELPALRAAAAGLAGDARLDWHVRALDPVFCAALDALRPAAGTSGSLALTLAGNRTALRDGERILPRLTMPDFAGELRVDYLGHDGSVMHLFPSVADPARKLAAQPARRLAAGEAVALGDGGAGKPVWEVGPPYGTDMIVAVASATPLLATPPAQNVEDDAGPYLGRLAAAIAAARRAGTQVAAARRAGTQVAAALLPVETLPKPRAQ